MIMYNVVNVVQAEAVGLDAARMCIVSAVKYHKKFPGMNLCLLTET